MIERGIQDITFMLVYFHVLALYPYDHNHHRNTIMLTIELHDRYNDAFKEGLACREGSNEVAMAILYILWY